MVLKRRRCAFRGGDGGHYTSFSRASGTHEGTSRYAFNVRHWHSQVGQAPA